MLGKSITLKAPAKVNLALEVLGKRADGYHEIRSVIQTIDLCDELTFEKSPVKSYSSDLSEWEGEKSLIARVVDLLKNFTGENGGVKITVKKQIPLSSGLGGDSSDAAAALKGLSGLWRLDFTQRKLLELAARLGSDVPFFLNGGTALMEGRGEKITPLPRLPESWFAVIIPDVPRLPHKTQALYAALKKEHYSEGDITDHLVKALKDGKKLQHEYLFNTFENVAFSNPHPLTPNPSQFSLYAYREHILKIGASNVHLAGSGPALFSLVSSKEEGEDLAERLKGQGMRVAVVSSF